MSLAKRYQANENEEELIKNWQRQMVYQYDPESSKPVYSIDTPPPTVSGHLHLGHVFSYSHADFIARYRRMRGFKVYYPMGFDDNGLPTERLVEKRLGIYARDIGREKFIQLCQEISEEAEKDYEQLWKRLGLSIDWNLKYRTIDDNSRKISQESFIDLYKKGLIYQKEAPTIWCPECQTAIAQADLDDIDRENEFVILKFQLSDDCYIPIATTRPELLVACVAIFVHPNDDRFQSLIGKSAKVPHYLHEVPIMADSAADPEKGTGAVMCCTFGDQTDVYWWQKYNLNRIELINKDGRLGELAGSLAGLTTSFAKEKIKEILTNEQYIIDKQPITQSVRVHERCDTPVEWIMTTQWFIRILSEKENFYKLAENIEWHPSHMINRYKAWVENLSWDWCISRQRYFGVPIPVWSCKKCKKIILPTKEQLPVDPLEDQPGTICECGSDEFVPEKDVLDTWATSSMTPQISNQWRENEDDIHKVLPLSLRPQAHEIIRTWAFYTIVKSYYQYNSLPWEHVLISGWGIAGEGLGKISKSRGGGPMPPIEMINKYSADAVRYWSASTTPGKDSVISEEKIQAGQKFIIKLWNVARFSERFLMDQPEEFSKENLLPSDLWVMAELQDLIRKVTISFENYDYARAKNEIESFFWSILTDNYVEFVKQRLYNSEYTSHQAARYTITKLLKTILLLLAPVLPFITDSLYQLLFSHLSESSIHQSSWPKIEPEWESKEYQEFGFVLLEFASIIRRYKSEHNLSLGSPLSGIIIIPGQKKWSELIEKTTTDLISVSRAEKIMITNDQEKTIRNYIPGQFVTLGFSEEE